MEPNRHTYSMPMSSALQRWTDVGVRIRPDVPPTLPECDPWAVPVQPVGDTPAPVLEIPAYTGVPRAPVQPPTPPEVRPEGTAEGSFSCVENVLFGLRLHRCDFACSSQRSTRVGCVLGAIVGFAALGIVAGVRQNYIFIIFGAIVAVPAGFIGSIAGAWAWRCMALRS